MTVFEHGITLFTSDRGIAPAQAALAAERAGFDVIYVPEHTHIPARRDAAHPGTGDETLPDDRYMRTLDPWIALATASSVTQTIRLSTAVALPVEHDCITLAKTIASLDHLSGGRVTLGVGFGWNTDELEDHNVPPQKRRTVLAEYLQAMRALWTDELASYDGQFVSFGPSWAWPKPVQETIPVVVGAGGGPKTFAWIAQHADGWMTTPIESDLVGGAARLREAWAEAGREGQPRVHVLAMKPPNEELFTEYESAGVTSIQWPTPDTEPAAVVAHIDRLGERLGLPRRDR